MHDFRDDYEMDEDGRLRKKRVLPDGATMHVPMGFYDGRFHPTFSDGSPDLTSPHRRGWRFADTNDAARIAADSAYEERSERMQTAWQRKGDAHAERTREAPCTATLDESRAKAEVAYAERTKRMANAWRNHHVPEV